MTPPPVPTPMPTLRGEERIYFEQARQRRLVHQVCESCGARIFYLRTVCPTCMSDDLRLDESTGNGRIHSFTTHHRAGHPAMADQVPYTVVLVDLEEGVRVLADLRDCPPDEVSIGMPVAVIFDDISDELTLPRFRPATEEEAR